MATQQFSGPHFKKNSFSSGRKFKGSGKNFIRKNEKIRAKEARVIGSNGQQLGILTVSDAIAIAKKQGL
ncbi:MAG: hypothetical protein LBT64_02350, partial [Puniceicoccales bacterium]|nr:hypothetical protein [Puniceicoccales bacterium]